MTNLDVWLKEKGIKPNVPKKFYIEAFREECQKNYRVPCKFCKTRCLADKVCKALDTFLCDDKKEFEKYANYEIKEQNL